MKNDFFKFPSTPHLVTLANVDVRGDKVLSDTEQLDFLQHELIVEEKVDGANLGISFDLDGNFLLQNRGTYLNLPGVGQWKKLGEWLNPKIDILFETLSDRYILFGEWCYAMHSVFYSDLPDWFLGFDLFDKQEEQFFSISRRNEMFEEMGIEKVPEIAKGNYSLSDIQMMLTQSILSNDLAEGLYLRIDQGDWLFKRAKLVRSSFIQSINGHWSRSSIKPNSLHSLK